MLELTGTNLPSHLFTNKEGNWTVHRDQCPILAVDKSTLAADESTSLGFSSGRNVDLHLSVLVTL